MDFYKVPHGLPVDTKLAVVAKRAGLKRGEVLALWVSLLDHASQADPRGSVSDIDLEEISTALDFDPAPLDIALKAFQDKGMILPDGLLTGWEKMQKLSTPRTRTHRRRSSMQQPMDFAIEEDDAARRNRLQTELLARHKRRGKTIAEKP